MCVLLIFPCVIAMLIQRSTEKNGGISASQEDPSSSKPLTFAILPGKYLKLKECEKFLSTAFNLNISVLDTWAVRST